MQIKANNEIWHSTLRNEYVKYRNGLTGGRCFLKTEKGVFFPNRFEVAHE